MILHLYSFKPSSSSSGWVPANGFGGGRGDMGNIKAVMPLRTRSHRAAALPWPWGSSGVLSMVSTPMDSRGSSKEATSMASLRAWIEERSRGSSSL
ncbi:hypothetical protein U9M48_035791 [Paspalum notatum var. saurae]|uniref:Uncharacterized protein n=1 Tax=Paspalum notatum var. saurae TaxID=547442 RepID=A0AAQ3UDC0_PASNO